jgi:hypothetical protein
MSCAFAWGLAIVGWGSLSFALAHNITTASALKKGLGAAYKEKLKEWRNS